MSAQTIDTATIRGTVSDAQGAVIVGAAVAAVNQSTGLKRDAVTNGDGVYTISNLPLTGKYKITVSSAGKGFADDVKSDIELRANESASFNFTLAAQA